MHWLQPQLQLLLLLSQTTKKLSMSQEVASHPEVEALVQLGKRRLRMKAR